MLHPADDGQQARNSTVQGCAFFLWGHTRTLCYHVHVCACVPVCIYTIRVVCVGCGDWATIFHTVNSEKPVYPCSGHVHLCGHWNHYLQGIHSLHSLFLVYYTHTYILYVKIAWAEQSHRPYLFCLTMQHMLYGQY